MASTDLAALERRARRGYEVGRVRQALLGVLPLLFIVPVAACMTHRPAATVVLGMGAFALSAIMLWYGRDPQKAVLPGVAAGLVPLTMALCANQMHYCGPDGCTSLCIPACTVGGVLAGLVVAWAGRKRRAGPWYWLSAASLALLTGAMGCSCIGYGGIVGLAAGFAAGLVPILLSRRRSEPPKPV
jgi:hypothetical protein